MSAKSKLSTVWVYVRIQLFVFVCGIVGPIFLIAYFTSQPNQELRFMYWAGLIITTVDVLIALFVTRGLETSRSTGSKKRSDR